eukprot:1161533-Pelagomonas_calceolata.AAC.4
MAEHVVGMEGCRASTSGGSASTLHTYQPSINAQMGPSSASLDSVSILQLWVGVHLRAYTRVVWNTSNSSPLMCIAAQALTEGTLRQCMASKAFPVKTCMMRGKQVRGKQVRAMAPCNLGTCGQTVVLRSTGWIGDLWFLAPKFASSLRALWQRHRLL